MRHEQRLASIIANVGIGGWRQMIEGDVMISAIAGRVCHHCRPIKTTSRSYRLKDLPRGRWEAGYPKMAKARWRKVY